MLPSDERATLKPNRPRPLSLAPVSFGPCWLQVGPERVNTHAAPMRVSSPSPPTSAVLPSDESATLWPNSPSPLSSPPVSFEPCWLQVAPERVNTHAAPMPLSSRKPPIRAVLPAEDTVTLNPKLPWPFSSPPVSFVPCWLQTDPERVNTHAAPILLLSLGAPISAVLPSADSAALKPNLPAPLSSTPAASLEPCWFHMEPERVNPHAAPTLLLSLGAPISAVLPSADSATLKPNSPASLSSL